MPFCLRMSEEWSHDIMQDSEDLELKTAFTECPSSSLEVFKIRLSVAHREMASELKYHQKLWNKIIMNHIPWVLYASTIPSSTEMESLKQQILMPNSSVELKPFSSSSHQILAFPDSVSIFKIVF